MKRILPSLGLLILLSGVLHAQATQFYLEDNIGEGLQARIYVIGQPQARAMVQDALYSAVDGARQALSQMKNDLAGIQGARGRHMVSPSTAEAIALGLDLAKKTDGLVDITGSGQHKKIKVNTRSHAVKIGGENIRIDLEPILKGFLADRIANDLVQAGWSNCLVKIGNVYVTRGNDANAPWRIPVVVPSAKIAKRVLYYQAKHEKAAGATGKAAGEAGANLDSVTVFSDSGAGSEGLAAAVLKMGLEEGKKFLARNKSLSAILVDKEGNLTNVP